MLPCHHGSSQSCRKNKKKSILEDERPWRPLVVYTQSCRIGHAQPTCCCRLWVGRVGGLVGDRNAEIRRAACQALHLVYTRMDGPTLLTHIANATPPEQVRHPVHPVPFLHPCPPPCLPVNQVPMSPRGNNSMHANHLPLLYASCCVGCGTGRVSLTEWLVIITGIDSDRCNCRACQHGFGLMSTCLRFDSACHFCTNNLQRK